MSSSLPVLFLRSAATSDAADLVSTFSHLTLTIVKFDLAHAHLRDGCNHQAMCWTAFPVSAFHQCQFGVREGISNGTLEFFYPLQKLLGMSEMGLKTQVILNSQRSLFGFFFLRNKSSFLSRNGLERPECLFPLINSQLEDISCRYDKKMLSRCTEK